MARAEIKARLTEEERRQLAALELIISQGKAAFAAVGKALLEIRRDKLYREQYRTFSAYCEERWGFSRAHGYRVLEAAKLADELSPIGDIQNEAQARTLACVPPHLREEVFRRAKEAAAKTSRGELTEPIIARVAIQVLDERTATAKEQEAAGGTDEDEDAPESESGDADARDEEDKGPDTPLARAARIVAPPKVHPLLRAAEHHRLGRKDSKKAVATDMEDEKLREAAVQMARDLEAEAAWLRGMLERFGAG